MSSGLEPWLERRRDRWQRVEVLLGEHRNGRRDSTEGANELVREYRALARDLALARGAFADSRITRYLEGLFARLYETIHQPPSGAWHQMVELYRDELPGQVRALWRPILASFLIFMLGGAVGAWLVHTYPELASLFASEEMIAKVQSGELWTDDILNIVPSSLLSLGIMTNNIAVTFFAFALGAFYGLGTLYIMGLNGLMLGGVFAFTAQYGLDDELFRFIIAHGVVELSVIILAGAAGIRLGEALIRPGNRSRKEAFHRAVGQAGVLIAVGAPFLVGAGIIEGYISPDPQYGLTLRIVVGLTYWILLLLVLSGRLWPRRGSLEQVGDPLDQ